MRRRIAIYGVDHPSTACLPSCTVESTCSSASLPVEVLLFWLELWSALCFPSEFQSGGFVKKGLRFAV